MTDSRALRQRIAELETLLAETRASQQDNRQHFQALVEHSPDLIARFDRQLRYIYANPAIEKVTGLPAAAFIGKTSREVGTPEELTTLWDPALRRVFESGQPERIEFAFDSPGSATRHYESQLSPEFADDGGVSHVLVMARDITDRKQTEAQNRDQTTLLASVNDAIVASDEQYRITAWNAAAEALYGWKAEEVLGRYGLEFTRSEWVGKDPDQMRRAIAEVGRWRGEGTQQRRDGTRFPVEMSVTALRDEAGRLTGYVSANRDITARKQAEEEMAALLRFQSEMLDTAAIWIDTLDTEGNITFWNRAAEQISGYARQDVLGHARVWEWLYPDPAQCSRSFSATMENVQKKGERLEHFETVIRRKDGESRVISWYSNNLVDGAGHVVGSIALGTDVTERREAEEALADERNLLRTLIDNLPDLIFLKDTEGRYIAFNPAIMRHLGANAPENVIGKTDFDFWSPELAQQYRADDQWVIQTGQPIVNREEPGVDSRGDASWYVTTKVPLRDAAGVIVGIIGTSHNIAERRQMEEALRESERAYRTLAENLPGIVYRVLLQQDGTMQFFNDMLFTLTGFRAEDLTKGKVCSIEPMIEPEDRPGVVAEVERAIAEDRPFRLEYRLKRRDGAIRHCLEQGKPVRDMAGNPLYIDGVIFDHTERKQAEESREKLQAQLVQAQKMEAMGQLTAGIAHDFNNMLTAIMGFAELAKLQTLPGDPLNDSLDKILGSGRSAAELVRQLTTFSRQQVLQPKVVDLNQVVDSMRAMLRRIIGEDITLKSHPDAHLWPVKVDPNQMQQVIVNLAVNARDAMPRGGQLTIETGNLALDDDLFLSHAVVRPGEYVVLSISDSGSGMNAEVQSHMFEPFFTTKPKGKGTGLGLSMVYGIVQQSGGHIGVQSQVGRGSTFDIHLPRSLEAAAAPAPVAQPAGPATGGQETILVAEDNAEVRGLAISALKMQGYTVLEASNGDEALRLAAAHSGAIHLLLTDIVMPGMNGRALAGRLTARHPQLRVIYMSGYTHEVIGAHMALAPGQPFLQKPFTVQEVVRLVREVLDMPAYSMARSR